ncbi:DEKNAAC103137 [Brettanomyces naardenensis]|uniref:DEKNAAC103137 n=1 Tax=Brettanomyces naardenensis TaxID=13370 RepID=A0A448YMD5_BRENA|nr:DEKNAAC103137 [Brettanomyces naardenensis]
MSIDRHRKFQRGRRSTPSSPALIPVSSASLSSGIPPPLTVRRRSSSRGGRYRRRRSSSSVRSIHFEPISSSSASLVVDENALDSDLNFVKATLDNTLPADYFKEDLLSVAKSLGISKWRKLKSSKDTLARIHLVRLSGALTNCIYKVSYKNYYPLLLRIYGANVDELIDRENELRTLARLSSQNIGPKLLGCFTNGRFEEFLNNSITLTKDQIRDGKVSRMIARRMKQLHYGVPLSPDEVSQGPQVWTTITKWVKVVDRIMNDAKDPSIQKQFLIVDWPTFKELIFKYHDWLYERYGGESNVDSSIKFCHNDTQYGNLLFYNKYDRLPMEEDEGEGEESEMDVTAESDIPPIGGFTPIDSDLVTKTAAMSITSSSSATLPLVVDLNFEHDKSLVVIDFEYSGPNVPAYDITNHFCEWMYDYHDVNYSYRTNEAKYPSREERVNFLNSYVNFVPGSATPHGYFNATTRSSSVVNLREIDLPPRVVRLFNETILWRASSAILWALWGIINKGTIEDAPLKKTSTYTETGPKGETYNITVESHDSSPEPNSSDEDMLDQNTDDKFDHIKYVLGKAGVVIGDLIQFGLVKSSDVDDDMRSKVKYLDGEFLHQ